MNERAEIILGYDYETLTAIADDVWHDEKPLNADDCNHEWECKFKEMLANAIESDYAHQFDLESLHPLVRMLLDFGDIDWAYIADNVFSTHVEGLIAEFTAECEQRELDEMSDSERNSYYNEIRGDQQYDAYVDDLINGDF